SLTMSNTGKSLCDPIAKAIKKVFIFPYFKADGTINSIDITGATPLNDAFFLALINNTTPSNRLYPLPRASSVTSPRAESIFETYGDDTKDFIREGVRSVVMTLSKQSAIYLGKIKDWKCQDIGVILVDAEGNMILSSTAAGLGYGIRIDKGSLDATLVFAEDNVSQKIEVKFNFHPDERDENLRVVLASNMPGANLLLRNGLIDVNAVYTTITATAFTATMTSDFGDPTHPAKIEGLVKADFVLKKGSAVIVITTVTETAPGVYAFVYPTQTTGTLTLTATKAGFDFSRINTAIAVS
ncbi:MAG: hypothetical protein JWR61_5846, partial [Ferruginibacter sp.]|uniref:hypothetical protein n=1 Tax=Ferruginibacter sp. TaxID=1940288 RepID=UPI00265979ED